VSIEIAEFPLFQTDREEEEKEEDCVSRHSLDSSNATLLEMMQGIRDIRAMRGLIVETV